MKIGTKINQSIKGWEIGKKTTQTSPTKDLEQRRPGGKGSRNGGKRH